MEMESYAASAEFRRFLDATLRRAACEAVDEYLSRNARFARKHQLASIPSVVRSMKLGGLRELARRQREKNTKEANQQREKNTKEANQAFWGFLGDLIGESPDGATPPFALSRLARELLEEKGWWENEASVEEKTEKKRMRRRNKENLERMMNAALEVYFEHFNCHYFFRRQGED